MLTQHNRVPEDMAGGVPDAMPDAIPGHITARMIAPPIPKMQDLPKMLDPDETIGAFVAAKPYITVPLDCPVDTIMTIMSHSGKRVAAIIDGRGTLKGFLTRSDLFNRMMIPTQDEVETRFPGWGAAIQEAWIKDAHVNGLRAGDVMTLNPAFLPSELTLKDAVTIMEGNGFHYMPVLGDGAYLLGIADLTELLAALAQRNQDFNAEDNLSVHLARPAMMHGVPYGVHQGASFSVA